ncbi:DUF1496 domain-containing protein (plasmid) [Vibrio tubiashii]|uniref:DUF1496 domain-containing protein n=1 Tax=Vibrio tubiashii TaxID=29498 RepID=UPI003CE5A3BC
MKKIAVLCLLPLAFLAQADETKYPQPPQLDESKYCFYKNQYWTEGTVIEMAPGFNMLCKNIIVNGTHLRWSRIEK